MHLWLFCSKELFVCLSSLAGSLHCWMSWRLTFNTSIAHFCNDHSISFSNDAIHAYKSGWCGELGSGCVHRACIRVIYDLVIRVGTSFLNMIFCFGHHWLQKSIVQLAYNGHLVVHQHRQTNQECPQNHQQNDYGNLGIMRLWRPTSTRRMLFLLGSKITCLGYYRISRQIFFSGIGWVLLGCCVRAIAFIFLLLLRTHTADGVRRPIRRGRGTLAVRRTTTVVVPQEPICRVHGRQKGMSLCTQRSMVSIQSLALYSIGHLLFRKVHRRSCRSRMWLLPFSANANNDEDCSKRSKAAIVQQAQRTCWLLIV